MAYLNLEADIFAEAKACGQDVLSYVKQGTTETQLTQTGAEILLWLRCPSSEDADSFLSSRDVMVDMEARPANMHSAVENMIVAASTTRSVLETETGKTGAQAGAETFSRSASTVEKKSRRRSFLWKAGCSASTQLKKFSRLLAATDR